MWPHKDLGWWAFVIAIIGLVLTYPLEVLAHITAPKWRDWWAARSQATLLTRIEKLKSEIAKMEGLTPLSEVEEHIIRRLEMVTVAVGFGIHGLLSTVAFGMLAYPPVSKSFANGLLAWMFVIMTFNFLLTYASKQHRENFRHPRSRPHRKRVEKELEKLSTRLK